MHEKISIDDALNLSAANRFPGHELLRKLAERARSNGRTEAQAACAFRSTPTFHDMMALVSENARASAEMLGYGSELYQDE